ncbi:SsrA-binding protein SmpB [Corynebacterium macclintockiae]|uniref:SsrA-binding protein SmpB n=1 Tax=Corynebacterium macclintockiae TaxID=2913501 RepID=UPI003EB9BE9B
MAAKKSTPTDSGKSKGKKGKPQKGAGQKGAGQIVVATNRKARHDYHIIDTYECGVVLVGTEVKSLREGKASLVDAYATIDEGEVWLRGLHIPEYSMGHWTNHSPRRTRKLLLHRREIDSLMGKVRDGNNTLVPLQLYFVAGKLKVELALARGKQEYDKRQDIKRRTEEREITRDLGRRIKGIKGGLSSKKCV